MTLIPAYGRDYKSAKAVQADWNANKDFKIIDMFGGNDGRAINKQDADPGKSYTVRYKRLTMVTTVKG